MDKKYMDESWLTEQYITNGMTIDSIQKECGVSHTTIEHYLNKYGIRKRHKARIPTRDELIDLHYNKGYGIKKMSKVYDGIGERTIKHLFDEYGIKQMSTNELQLKWWSNVDNKKVMSEKRLKLWKDDEYYSKTSKHLFDERSIRERSIKYSARYQGVSVDDWDGFITKERTRIRKSCEYTEWRNSVFRRDDYTCQRCHSRSRPGAPVELHAHHIESFADNKDLRFDVSNGITLCRDCHDIRVPGSFHNIYGVHHNNRKQLKEYLDIDADEEIGMYFKDGDISVPEKKGFEDL